MRIMTHLIVGSIVATALLAGTAVTASAQSTTIKDKRADVERFDGSPFNSEVLNTSKSVASGVDITKAKVTYTKKRLKVTLKFAKLKRKVRVYAVVQVNGVATNRFSISNNGSRKKVTVSDARSGKKQCTGKLTRKNGTKGTMTFTVPRSCLDKQKSIRIKTFASRSDGRYHYQDPVSAKQKKSAAYTKWLKAS